MHFLDQKFATLWPNYLLQAFLAGVGALLATLVFRVADSPVVVASMASTAFVVFSLPSRNVAKARHVIGGHTISMLVGAGIFLLRDHYPMLPLTVACALSVFVAFFLMVLTDTDHPPAAGTAMGLVMLSQRPTWLLFGAIVAGASVFSVARLILLKRIIDLR